MAGSKWRPVAHGGQNGMSWELQRLTMAQVVVVGGLRAEGVNRAEVKLGEREWVEQSGGEASRVIVGITERK